MHFLQSQIWKESKRNLGNLVFDVNQYFFQTTKLPILPLNIGYMPRPNLRSIEWKTLVEKGLESKSIFITIDPENLKSEIPDSKEYISRKFKEINPKIKVEYGKPIHLQKNLVINLNDTSTNLLAKMKQKHRYNLKLAAKKGIEVDIGESDQMLNEFLQLHQETVDRKEYSGRSKEYIYTVWSTIKEARKEDLNLKTDVKIATAYFQNKPLASWMLFLHENTIYYPYGGSSSEMKNLMAPYALFWGVVEWGKSEGYRRFDTWGIKESGQKMASMNISESNSEQGTNKIQPEIGLNSETHSNEVRLKSETNINLEEPLGSTNSKVSALLEGNFEGYSRFKVGFGGEIIEYADSVDIVFQPVLYRLLKLATLLKDLALKIRKR